MADKSELLRGPAFVDLPEDQIDWFLGHAEELHLKAGNAPFRQGDPAEAMFVILEGQLQARGELGGETVVISTKPGDVTGVLPFSRMKQFPLNARATTDAKILRFPSSLFPELVQKMPELTKRLVGLMSDRIRETTRMEQQRDRLASMGKLSAGLAHELNNPASAAKRAAAQLREVLKKIRDASHELGRRELTAAQKSEIEKLEASFMQHGEVPFDPLQLSDLEGRIDSFGSELNQVWTNIIDNAIDAMGGKGELRVRTYREDDCVVVEIADNGPGISPAIQPHIFEPFFTTKKVGEGTGLGLDTALRIVKKHRGTIEVSSKPGDTRFQVWLPLAEGPIHDPDSGNLRAH